MQIIGYLNNQVQGGKAKAASLPAKPTRRVGTLVSIHMLHGIPYMQMHPPQYYAASRAEHYLTLADKAGKDAQHTGCSKAAAEPNLARD